jgi:phosphoribosylformimino-5-aminoimidazole carboxamide ribotide isomerase
MSQFRPCIDLHDGKVKQIVGGSLKDSGPGPRENFISDRSASSYAELYRKDKLAGGHIIQLGPGNGDAARSALAAWPGGMQLGGGIDISNAVEWLEAGASHVIVTSWLFDENGKFSKDRLQELAREVGREHLVVDLSCRRVEDGWKVAMNRWQTLTDVEITITALDVLAEWCSEYLVHAADVEGLCKGIDTELVELLGSWDGIPVTYAGGVASMSDVQSISARSGGRVDFTVGSALDLFGGNGVQYDELLSWNSDHS